MVIFHSYVSLPEGTPFDPPLKSSSCSLMFSLQLTLKIDHVGCICPEFSRRIQISSKLIIKWCNSYHIILYYIRSNHIISPLNGWLSTAFVGKNLPQLSVQARRERRKVKAAEWTEEPTGKPTGDRSSVNVWSIYHVGLNDWDCDGIMVGLRWFIIKIMVMASYVLRQSTGWVETSPWAFWYQWDYLLTS